KDVLEAGCGAGLGLPVLASAARSVQAGDVDVENLRAAGTACAGKSNIQLRWFAAEQLPFPPESFDLVLLFEAIYYLPDAPRFLQEAHRILRPGGSLLIVTVNPEWIGFNPSPFRIRYYSAAELQAALEQAGFAARVQGAFLETGGGASSAIRWSRRAAVALKLVPRTMRGKALLKRIFYGGLTRLPGRLPEASRRSPALEELDGSGAKLRRCRVLYATAQKPTI
ncbi:MAG TPA: class I SAM-dependent methyltransferase, partial [Bryobacteraceae bacterium]|nr:class I SAM-dependent methyltransferase [Bryobacteraceae bacterium]